MRLCPGTCIYKVPAQLHPWKAQRDLFLKFLYFSLTAAGAACLYWDMTFCGDSGCRTSKRVANYDFVLRWRNPLGGSCVSDVQMCGKNTNLLSRLALCGDCACRTPKRVAKCESSCAGATLCGDGACQTFRTKSGPMWQSFTVTRLLRVKVSVCKGICVQKLLGVKIALCIPVEISFLKW